MVVSGGQDRLGVEVWHGPVAEPGRAPEVPTSPGPYSHGSVGGLPWQRVCEERAPKASRRR